MENTLADYFPADVVNEVIPYLSIPELAFKFLESGLAEPDIVLWQRIYRQFFPVIYTKVKMSPERAIKHLKEEPPTKDRRDLITVFLMLRLIPRNQGNEMLTFILGSPYARTLKGPNIPLFLTLTNADPVTLWFTHRDLMTRLHMYTGLLFMVDRTPYFDDIKRMLFILTEAIINIAEHNADVTPYEQHYVERVTRDTVKYYFRLGYRPFDLPVNPYSDSTATLLGVLINTLPQLAIEFVQTYEDDINLLWLDQDGNTYLHQATNNLNIQVYSLLNSVEPKLGRIRNIRAKIPRDLWNDRVIERDEQDVVEQRALSSPRRSTPDISPQRSPLNSRSDSSDSE